MNWLYITVGILSLLCAWFARVYLDIQQRKRRLEAEGIPVIWQPFIYSNLFVNLIPKNRFTTWLFPLRFGLEYEYANLFKRFNSNIFAFVSYQYQEILTNDAKLCREITVTRRKDFDKPWEIYDIVRLFGDNVVTALEHGGEWKRHRSIIGPAFSEGNNALVAESTAKHLNYIMDGWDKQEQREGELRVDMDAEVVRLALAVIGSAGMGIDLTTAVDCVPDKNGVMHKLSLRDALQDVSQHLLARLLMPKLLLNIPFGIFKKVKVAYDEFRIYMKDFCEERKQKQEEEERKSGKKIEFRKEKEPISSPKVQQTEEELRQDKKRGDLLTNLVINNTVLTTDEIFGDIFMLLLAGHETTAHTITWCIRLLAAYPEKQEKLYQEAVSVLGDRTPTYEDFEKLVYARCVFKEALRLYPQVAGIPKFNKEGIELAGYNLPPQTRYTITITALLDNEKYWDAPEEFQPERFDSRLPGYKPIDPYVYVPFSVGRRSCLGTKFAQVEGTIALAVLCRKYCVEKPEGISRSDFLERKTFLTVHPKHDVKLVLKKRESEVC